MFTLTFKTDNSAFDDENSNTPSLTEVARVLHSVATRISALGKTEERIQDANGNTIGHFQLTED
jgi:hypothetical protein